MEPTDLQVLKSLRSGLGETIAGDDALAAAAEGDGARRRATSRRRVEQGAEDSGACAAISRCNGSNGRI